MSRHQQESPVPSPAWARVVALVLVCIGIAAGHATAGTCERTPDMPLHVPRLIDEALPQPEYKRRAEQWRSWSKAHPQSAIALVELERALRYSNQIKPPEQLSMLRQAVSNEPDCAVALDRLATLEFENTIWGDRSQLPRARELAARALAQAPDAWEPHQTLWMFDVVAGTGSEAAAHMSACLDKGAFPSPLLDYAYNMLSSATPHAIVFTNGDHDTFPLLALQARYGIRPDVRIVNLSMATFPSYAKWALNGDSDGGPLSDSDIDALYETKKTGVYFGRLLLQELAQRITDGRCNQSIFAAVTVARLTDTIPNRLDMQGLLLRIRPEAAASPEEAMRVDVARTDSLFEHMYRMESSMDLGFRWESQPALAQLMGNYVGSYRQMLSAYADTGDLEAARHMLRNILPLLEFHKILRYWDGRDRAEILLTYWEELDPDNPEVDRWRQRLEL